MPVETIHRDILEVGVSQEAIEQQVTVVTDPYIAAEGAHALATFTEWDEFRDPDLARIYKLMLKPAFVFDGRAILAVKVLKNYGFEVFVIGNNSLYKIRDQQLMFL